MPVSNEQFLFCCIENSDNGKINWQQVAVTCELPSKGAAAIKFDRMKKKFGTVSGGTVTDGGNETAADGEKGGKTATKKTKATKEPASKKRKVQEEESEAYVKEEDGEF